MNRWGLLDPNKAAGDHVTQENVNIYLTELNGRVSAMPAHNHFRLHIVIVEQYKEEAIEDMEGNLSVPRTSSR